MDKENHRPQHSNTDASTINPVESVSQPLAERDATLHAARTAVRDTTRLTRLLTILSDPTPLDQLLDQVLSTLSEIFAADIVVLLDPISSGTFAPLASIGLPEIMRTMPFSNSVGSHTTNTIKSHEPILLDEIDPDVNVDDQLRDLGAKTAVWLPVIGNYAARGVLILARCKPAPFEKTEVGLLSAMAHRIGLSLEQAQRSTRLENLVFVGQQIGSALDESTVYSKIVAFFPAIIGADSAALFVKDTSGKPVCVAETRFNPDWIPAWTSLTDVLISSMSIDNIKVYETAGLNRVITQHRLNIPENCKDRAKLAVPIRYKAEIHGILYGMRFLATNFNPDTVQIAMLYAGQTSAAIENARLYHAVQDELTEREHIEEALRASDERYRALIRSVSDVILILTADGRFLYVSPAAEIAWECSIPTLLTQNIFDRIHAEDHDVFRSLLTTLLDQPQATITHPISFRHGENDWRDFEVILTNLLDEPAVGGIVATCHDITERKTHELELRKLAFRDPLTGLSNRAHFRERLYHALVRANAENQSVALIYFDLDNFKMVNDSLGHEYGDQVLCITADRLRACLRREDLAARLGGDEFTVLVESVTDVDQVMKLTHRINKSINHPIRLDEVDLSVGGSLGIAISAPHLDSVDDLLRKADLAMYDAKSRGKGIYSIYDAKMDESASRRLGFETEIQQALEQDEFRVYYQPIYSLNDHQICAVEAFARWQHPQHGLILPSEFIPLAEETGAIIQLGKWILSEACRQYSAWLHRYKDRAPGLLNINLSARQLRFTLLEREINTALKKTSLDPSHLMVEISEKAFAQDADTTIGKLNALKDKGIKIAIDDFGIGSVNLNFLKSLSIDALKIDLSLIRGMEDDPRNTAIVEGVVFSALSMGLSVIAEGIETAEQAALLQSIGCNYGQGFLFSPALTAEDFTGLLEMR